MDKILDNQQFSEKTLKGFLLKNVNPNTKIPAVHQLNKFLVERVDKFWDDVVVPLQKDNHFDGNKIQWYFEIYKEGHEAKKVKNHPFIYLETSQDKLEELISTFQGKTVEEYIDFGTSYLSNAYTLLTSWKRDMLVLKRLETIYSSSNPCHWIYAAEKDEKNENGVMRGIDCGIKGLDDVTNNIGLIISRRV